MRLRRTGALAVENAARFPPRAPLPTTSTALQTVFLIDMESRYKGKLLKQLVRHHRDGEFLRAVRVPSVEQEDERRLHRELERLTKERTGHRNRLQSLLVTHGVVLKPGRDFLPRLNGVVLWNGASLPTELKAECEREYAAAGLVGTPYASGESTREQGINKAGNGGVRRLMVELGWFWLRYQPDSALSRWFRERLGGGGKRCRRIGMVALARRLLIALWRYLEFGEVPAGAELKPV